MTYQAVALAIIITGGIAVLIYAGLFISALIPKKRRYGRFDR